MKRRRFLPWMIAAGLLLALVGGLRWVTNPVDSKIPTSVPAAAHSTAISLEKSASRSRMIDADPTGSHLSAKDNAANDYRRAFALIEKLTPRELAIINLKTPPQPPATDEEIAALLEKIAPIIAAFEAGAAKPGCDWGIRHVRVETNLPFLKPALDLGKVVLWDSRQRIGDQPDDVMQHLEELRSFGNQIDIAIVAGMVNVTLQTQIHRFLGEQAAQLPAAIRQKYLAGTDSGALLGAFGRAIVSERQGNPALLDMVRTESHSDGTPLTDAERLFLFQGNSKSNVLAQVEDYGRSLAVMSESLFWSDSQLLDWQRQNLSGAFFASVADPNNDLRGMAASTRESMRRGLVEQEIVRAGLGILNSGPSALARFPDPITGQPFRYRTTDALGSFELQSTVLQKGKPVSLTFQQGETGNALAP